MGLTCIGGIAFMLKVLIEDMNAALLNSVIASFIIGFVVMIYNYKIGFLITLLLTLASIISYMVKRQKSIDNLERIVENIANGKPVKKLDVFKESQLSSLHASINKLSDSVVNYRDEVINQKSSLKSVMNDISTQLMKPIESLHELKIQGNANLIDEKTSLQIAKLKSLVDSMSRLVNLETHNEVFCVVDMRVDDLIRDALNEIDDDLNEAKLEIIYKPSEAVATFDLDKTKEVILHVLNNKLRYAKSKILIELQENPISVYVKIFDDGQQITGDTRNRVFDKFYSENNDREESLGIGLAVAKEIMNHQNGDLTLEGGNTFVLRFNKK